MSGSARQSYYEIALTHRQVLTVFVVLLVAVLAAFLSGVWVGRSGFTADGQTAEAQTIEAAAEPGSESLARLDFFSRDSAGSGAPPPAEADSPAAEPAREVEPRTAAAEEPAPADEPGEETAPAAAPADEPGEETAPAAAPADEPGEETAPAAAPAEETVVAEAPSPAPEPEIEAPPPAPAPAAGVLVVQVFSSSNQVQAQGVVDRLRSGGFPALLSPVEVAGRTMYRVRIGPYSDRQVAEGIAEQIRRDFRLETWITQ